MSTRRLKAGFLTASLLSLCLLSCAAPHGPSSDSTSEASTASATSSSAESETSSAQESTSTSSEPVIVSLTPNEMKAFQGEFPKIEEKGIEEFIEFDMEHPFAARPTPHGKDEDLVRELTSQLLPQEPTSKNVYCGFDLAQGDDYLFRNFRHEETRHDPHDGKFYTKTTSYVAYLGESYSTGLEALYTPEIATWAISDSSGAEGYATMEPCAPIGYNVPSSWINSMMHWTKINGFIATHAYSLWGRPESGLIGMYIGFVYEPCDGGYRLLYYDRADFMDLQASKEGDLYLRQIDRLRVRYAYDESSVIAPRSTPSAPYRGLFGVSLDNGEIDDIFPILDLSKILEKRELDFAFPLVGLCRERPNPLFVQTRQNGKGYSTVNGRGGTFYANTWLFQKSGPEDGAWGHSSPTEQIKTLFSASTEITSPEI